MIYRPNLPNLQTRKKKQLKEWLVVAKELSVNVKTKNSFKHEISTNLKNFGQLREIILLPKFPIKSHSVHWGINPTVKTLTPLFFQAPLRSAHCPSPPFLGNTLLYIMVFREIPLKNLISQ